jgi:hypothetical protein
MLKPILTDILCISCINSFQCSKLTKHAWCPQTTSVLTWMMCEWGYICAKLWSNNCGAYSDRPTPPLVEESIFPNTWMALERWKLWSCVLTMTETKNDFAGENQQQFTRVYWTNDLYRLDRQGFGVWVLVETWFFSSPCHPDLFWGPPSLLLNCYWGSSNEG